MGKALAFTGLGLAFTGLLVFTVGYGLIDQRYLDRHRPAYEKEQYYSFGILCYTAWFGLALAAASLTKPGVSKGLTMSAVILMIIATTSVGSTMQLSARITHENQECHIVNVNYGGACDAHKAALAGSVLFFLGVMLMCVSKASDMMAEVAGEDVGNSALIPSLALLLIGQVLFTIAFSALWHDYVERHNKYNLHTVFYMVLVIGWVTVALMAAVTFSRKASAGSVTALIIFGSMTLALLGAVMQYSGTVINLHTVPHAPEDHVKSGFRELYMAIVAAAGLELASVFMAILGSLFSFANTGGRARLNDGV